MRKMHQQQAVEFVKLLEQAHSEIKNVIEKKDISVAQSLLADCQEGAIQLGNLIETTEGEGFKTISILEEYCELIYQFHERLGQGENVAPNKVYKTLRQALIKVENSIKFDIPIKKEVVFLPYKASMWDSLESVWKAADEDPDCDAYVIPIPYYDKNPDGSFRERHYEGDQYPKYVPITQCEDYDFAKRRPDIIYIHNPYDEYNYVTSVDPFFYSGKLKEYTDKLVYIPYYILAEPDLNNEESLEGMAHFCTAPAVINADQVIVQSEGMREAYIKILSKIYGEDTRAHWAKKILGTGSPKVDKLLNTKLEDLDIPAEWLKIIQKPNGSWKKIILYNTSVTSLLNNNEKMLEKMQDVFQDFQENQDEVALLWRPHPLIQATIESMRPQLWAEYKKLREQYRAEGWGIYDDTADLDRAIILSDAYYGDGSSLMHLYRAVGKPVMVQNVIIRCKESKLRIEDAVQLRENIWFCAQRFNGLFSLNTNTGKIEKIGEFPLCSFGKERLFASMELVGEKIYFIPLYANSIMSYNISLNKFESIEIDLPKADTNGQKLHFMGVQKYKKYLFIFPVTCKVIIRLDTSNNQITYLTEWVNDAEKLIFDKQDGYFRKQVAIRNNKLYIPFCNANAILTLDCETMQCKIHKLGSNKQGYSGICYDGKNFWISPRKGGNITIWNPDDNSIQCVKMSKLQKDSLAYVGIIYYNDRVKLFSCLDESESQQIEEDFCNVDIMNGKYSFAKADNNHIIYYEINEGELYVIDNENEKRYSMKIENINIHEIAQERIVVENEEMVLHQYIKAFR